MKYGILGDIHANLSALQAVLEQFDAWGVQRTISVGDVVGYGAAPEACIALLRERETLVVKGNHDAAVVGELDERYFNAFARDAVCWTRNAIDEDCKRWLRNLPLVGRTEHLEVSHGCLAAPEEFNYVQMPRDAEPSLDVLERRVGFVGHTHVPIALIQPNSPGPTGFSKDTVLEIGEFDRTLVNVGSVGQPRDGDNRAAYALYDSDTMTVEIRRVEYDRALEADRIRTAGLPSMLADRLDLGV